MSNFNNPYNTLYQYQGQPGPVQPAPMQFSQSQMPSQGVAGAPPSGGKSGGMGGGVPIGGLLQTGFGIWSAIRGAKDRKKFAAMAESELNNRPEYQISPYAKQELAQAQAQANAINPAVAMAQRQAQVLAANTAAVGQRNAQSGAEAIQAAAMGQAQAQAMQPQLAQMQTDYNMQNQMNMVNAMRGMTGQLQNRFADRLDRNNTRLNYRLGQLGGANKMFGDGWSNMIGGVNNIEGSIKESAQALAKAGSGGM